MKLWGTLFVTVVMNGGFLTFPTGGYAFEIEYDIQVKNASSTLLWADIYATQCMKNLSNLEGYYEPGTDHTMDIKTDESVFGTNCAFKASGFKISFWSQPPAGNPNGDWWPVFEFSAQRPDLGHNSSIWNIMGYERGVVRTRGSEPKKHCANLVRGSGVSWSGRVHRSITDEFQIWMENNGSGDITIWIYDYETRWCTDGSHSCSECSWN